MIHINQLSLPIHELIGKGQYGNVYRAGDEYALKGIKTEVSDLDPLSYLLKDVQFSTKERVTRELKVQRNVKSKYIAEIHDVKVHRASVWILMPLYKTSLTNIIPMSESKALSITRKLVMAITDLNHMNYSHKDLKLDNIMMDGDDPKIIDFGFASDYCINDRLQAGTTKYMAPEVMNCIGNSSKADIWSLGVILYEMLMGKLHLNSNNVMRSIQQLPDKLQSSISDDTRNLMRRMLQMDYWNRISASQILKLLSSS